MGKVDASGAEPTALTVTVTDARQGAYAARIVPNCVSVQATSDACFEGGRGYVGTLTIGPSGAASESFAVQTATQAMTSTSLALFRVAQGVPAAPDGLACVAVACGTLRPRTASAH